MKEHRIRIENGEAQFIYDDDLVGLLASGRSSIGRASYVEPAWGGGWTADMRPVDGPVLGPFATRGEALAEERGWLQRERGL